MKKNKSIKKKLIFLLVFSLSFFIFVGCQSKAAANDSKRSTGNNKNFNTADMKKKMQDSINPLVVNKTLTKAQEDKIVAALTSTNNKKTNASSNSQTPKSGQATGAQGERTNMQTTALNKLVTDKVITKAQSDAVTKVIKVNTTHTRNSNPTQS